MSHSAVRAFIEAKATGLSTSVQFGYGRASDFNQIKDKGYPYIWCDLLRSRLNITDGLMVTETYSVAMTFYKYDHPDSTQEQYKLILDNADLLVQEFFRDINEDLTVGDLGGLTTGNVELSGISKEPFVKQMADCLTGWMVTFDLTVPDKFDYC